MSLWSDPDLYARLGGLFYLYIIIAGIATQFFVRGRLITSQDPAATADKILNAESTFRRAFVAELLMFLCDVALSAILYVLLRAVNPHLALLTSFFRLSTAVVLGFNLLNHFAALLVLTGPETLTAFPPPQQNQLAFLFLKLHSRGYHLGLVFFGVHCLLLGALVYAAAFLPLVIGVLLIVAGICYLVNSVTTFGSSRLAAKLPGWILLPALIAELSLSLWLLLMGVVGHPGLG